MRALLFAIGVLLGAACGASGNGNGYDARPSADAPPAVDAAPGGEDASCFTNPQTHYEIINACTNAASADKHPVLPGLLPNGALPPLP
jgi:hypothetical protein